MKNEKRYDKIENNEPLIKLSAPSESQARRTPHTKYHVGLIISGSLICGEILR